MLLFPQQQPATRCSRALALGRRREKRRLDEEPLATRVEEDTGGKLLPVHSAIASDSRGFLREPGCSSLGFGSRGILVALPRLPLRPSSLQGGGADSMQRRLRGCPLKGRPKGKTFDGELRADLAARSNAIRAASSRDARTDSRESYESPDS